jgi:hypothetical protein
MRLIEGVPMYLRDVSQVPPAVRALELVPSSQGALCARISWNFTCELSSRGMVLKSERPSTSDADRSKTASQAPFHAVKTPLLSTSKRSVLESQISPLEPPRLWECPIAWPPPPPFCPQRSISEELEIDHLVRETPQKAASVERTSQGAQNQNPHFRHIN